MKIALVDDEIHALRHMERLLGMVQDEKPFSYTNPRRALEELPARQPEILLVDVMMPVMTGLEFAERYLKLCPFATVVILTSYRDFDFAKKSVELGVYDYWLKNELRLGNFQEKWEALVKAARKKAESREARLRELTARIFTGQAGAREAFPPKDNSRYFLLGVVRRGSRPERELANFTEVTESTPFVRGIGPNAGFSFCLCRFTEAEESLWPEILRLAGSSVRATAAAVSPPFSELDETGAVHTFFSCIHNFYLVPGSVGVPETARPELYREDSAFLTAFSKEYLAAMPEKIQRHDKEGLRALLRALWASPCLRAGNLAVLRLSLDFMAELCDTLAPGSKWRKSLEQLKEENLSLRQLRSTTLSLIEGALASWQSGLKYDSPFINQTVKYIEDHYAEDLHVSLLAERLALSPDYLRKLFKAETGVGIADYITATRLSVAQKLLLSGQYRIYQVADMVGYNSAAYFSQAYYKYYGVSPKEGQKEKPR